MNRKALVLLALSIGIPAGGCRDHERLTATSRTRYAPSSVYQVASAGEVNIYASTGAGDLSSTARRALPRVYVPNSVSGTLSVIDPQTYEVLRTFPTGRVPQHVVPSWDLQTLWVANNGSNSLTPIDPVTSKEGPPVAVSDPYNVYFTPDGREAMIIAEARKRIDFREPHTMKLIQPLRVGCRGLDHVEFTADDRYAIATCEFTGTLVKIDLATHSVSGYLTLRPESPKRTIAEHLRHLFRHQVGEHAMDESMRAMPQDIRSSADGRTFYVADMLHDGVILIDPSRFEQIGFLPTGVGTHGIYPSRDGTRLYVSNRGWHSVFGGRHGPGSVSVIDLKTNRVIANWPIPGGGSPDMGNVTADGKELWLSGRYDDEVYVFDTATGRLTHRIAVGREPHGLCVWPQPGRFSVGHTGNMR